METQNKIKWAHDSKWKVGDAIDISENQKSLMNEANAISILNPIIIPNYDNYNLDIKIREFLSFYVGLCVKYIKKDNKVKQEIVDSIDVKIKIKYREINRNNKGLQKESMKFLKRECDFFNGELIRMIVFDDKRKKDKRIIILGIHYSLIDMHTNMTLSKNLYDFFYDLPIETNYTSSFDYVNWQKKFLSSTLGFEKREFWNNLLKSLELKNKNHAKIIIESSEKEFIVKKIIIKGRKLENLKLIVRKTKLPLSAFLLSVHQKLIRGVFKKGHCLQLIRVDGRERSVYNLDISNVFGMVANSIPIPVINCTKLSREILLGLYIVYCNARLNQHIPFEVIKRDFEEKENIDINSYIAGLFNFVSLEHKYKKYKTLNPFKKYIYTQKKEFPKSEKPLNLYCTLYQNSLEIEMRCKHSFYEKNKEKLNLNKILNKEIIF